MDVTELSLKSVLLNCRCLGTVWGMTHKTPDSLPGSLEFQSIKDPAVTVLPF